MSKKPAYDRTIYSDKDAEMLSFVTDATIREELDSHCKKFTEAKTTDELIVLHRAANEWIRSIIATTDREVINKIIAIVTSASGRMAVKITLGTKSPKSKRTKRTK